jgi:hypothetical protein
MTPNLYLPTPKPDRSMDHHPLTEVEEQVAASPSSPATPAAVQMLCVGRVWC